ncbi:MAG: hypothetical protein WD402_00005 [Chloroflexota bacterium]
MKRRFLRIGLIGLFTLAIPTLAVLANGPVGNHGADVSTIAKDKSTTGRAHGEAVSEAARANHGADVSAVATDDSTTGRAHGEAVSVAAGAHGEAVSVAARGDHGKP